jgi:unsaturated rhamnogalacturonyl hydrolase
MKNLAFLPLAVLIFSGCTHLQKCGGAEADEQLSPKAILASMEKVADWQLTNASPSDVHYPRNGWTWGAFYDGVMALDSIAGTRKKI